MAQTYSLDEAAQRLGVAPEELKRRMKEDWKNLRPFRDGSTLRFRTSEIDELARSLGQVSDPSLQLAPLDLPSGPPTSGDFQLPEVSSKSVPVEEPILFELSDQFPTPLEEADLGKAKKGDSDSDVRLDPAPKVGKAKDAAAVPTEEVDIDLSGPGSAVIRGGSAARLTGPKSSTKLSASDSNKNIDAPNLGDSSEFELSLDADSDDFELQLNADSSDEDVSLGDLPSGQGKNAGDSGINLREPVDSGVNLEKKKGPVSGIKPPSGSKLGKAKPEPDSDIDFELALDPPVGASGTKLGASKSGKLPPISDSDSEFELTLDDPSGSDDSLMSAAALPEDEEKNDIFETDFEIPPLETPEDDSGSEAVAIEGSDTDLESSDFDLALDSSDVEVEDESASQVVLLEDDSESAAPVKAKKKKAVEDEDVEDEDESSDVALDEESDVSVETEEDEESAAGALAGVKGRRRFDDDEDEEEDVKATPSSAAAALPWGPVPAIFLLPAFVVMILGGLIGFEMLHSMWGYHQPTQPAAPVVRGVAELLEMDIKEQ